MDRRQFIKMSTATCGAAALLPKDLHAQAEKPAASAPSGASKTSGKVPAWVKSMRESDMDGMVNGKPDPNYRATGTGHTPAKVDLTKSHQMKLTREEQAIMDGKEGEIKAKVMKTVVAFGNAFGATKLVKLEGAPHTSMYNAPQFMEPMIAVFEKCADD
ncbi:MAG: aconitase X, partial [Planctomycetota bacterium]